MSRIDRDRLLDILAAMAAIQQHVLRGPLDDGLIFDAVRVRLVEIGEAVKDLDAEAGSATAGPVAPGRRHARSAGPPLLRHLTHGRRPYGHGGPVRVRAAVRFRLNGLSTHA